MVGRLTEQNSRKGTKGQSTWTVGGVDSLLSLNAQAKRTCKHFLSVGRTLRLIKQRKTGVF